MSRYIAKAAIRGATEIVDEAERMLSAAIAEFGPDKAVAFTNTAYYLPVILGFTGMEVSTLGGLQKAVDYAKSLMNPVPEDSLWLPYLG
jgi:acetyl-CoA synthase